MKLEGLSDEKLEQMAAITTREMHADCISAYAYQLAAQRLETIKAEMMLRGLETAQYAA